MAVVRREGEQPGDWLWRRQDAMAALEPWRARNPRIRRWIGAARRRALRLRREEDTDGGQVITLTWAQTFGRPSTPRPEAVALAPGQAHGQNDGRTQGETVVLFRRG